MTGAQQKISRGPPNLGARGNLPCPPPLSAALPFSVIVTRILVLSAVFIYLSLGKRFIKVTIYYVIMQILVVE
jgi:hypothetical protein